MRSLWRILALQWLGGDGSEALIGDSTILEGLPYGGNILESSSCATKAASRLRPGG